MRCLKSRIPKLGSRATKSFSLEDFAHTHPIASYAAALTLSRTAKLSPLSASFVAADSVLL